MPSCVVAPPSCGTRNRLLEAVDRSPRCGSCRVDLRWPVDSSDDGFAAAVDTDRLVLVDLRAPWCGPGRKVASVRANPADEPTGPIKVANVDENPPVARRYGARSIPMLLSVRDGELVDTVVGARPELLQCRHIDGLPAAA